MKKFTFQKHLVTGAVIKNERSFQFYIVGKISKNPVFAHYFVDTMSSEGGRGICAIFPLLDIRLVFMGDITKKPPKHWASFKRSKTFGNII